MAEALAMLGGAAPNSGAALVAAVMLKTGLADARSPDFDDDPGPARALGGATLDLAHAAQSHAGDPAAGRLRAGSARLPVASPTSPAAH